MHGICRMEFYYQSKKDVEALNNELLIFLQFEFFDHDLNHRCLIYMFSFRFSKLLIKLRLQFPLRKIFGT